MSMVIDESKAEKAGRGKEVKEQLGVVEHSKSGTIQSSTKEGKKPQEAQKYLDTYDEDTLRYFCNEMDRRIAILDPICEKVIVEIKALIDKIVALEISSESEPQLLEMLVELYCKVGKSTRLSYKIRQMFEIVSKPDPENPPTKENFKEVCSEKFKEPFNGPEFIELMNITYAKMFKTFLKNTTQFLRQLNQGFMDEALRYLQDLAMHPKNIRIDLKEGEDEDTIRQAFRMIVCNIRDALHFPRTVVKNIAGAAVYSPEGGKYEEMEHSEKIQKRVDSFCRPKLEDMQNRLREKKTGGMFSDDLQEEWELLNKPGTRPQTAVEVWGKYMAMGKTEEGKQDAEEFFVLVEIRVPAIRTAVRCNTERMGALLTRFPEMQSILASRAIVGTVLNFSRVMQQDFETFVYYSAIAECAIAVLTAGSALYVIAHPDKDALFKRIQAFIGAAILERFTFGIAIQGFEFLYPNRENITESTFWKEIAPWSLTLSSAYLIWNMIPAIWKETGYHHGKAWRCLGKGLDFFLTTLHYSGIFALLFSTIYKLANVNGENPEFLYYLLCLIPGSVMASFQNYSSYKERTMLSMYIFASMVFSIEMIDNRFFSKDIGIEQERELEHPYADGIRIGTYTTIMLFSILSTLKYRVKFQEEFVAEQDKAIKAILVPESFKRQEDIENEAGDIRLKQKLLSPEQKGIALQSEVPPIRTQRFAKRHLALIRQQLLMPVVTPEDARTRALIFSQGMEGVYKEELQNYAKSKENCCQKLQSLCGCQQKTLTFSSLDSPSPMPERPPRRVCCSSLQRLARWLCGGDVVTN